MLWIKLRRLWPSSEKGQTLVMVAVVFVVLLGVGALSVDVGQLLWSRGEEQNIADAAALAGVRALPLPTTTPDLCNNAAVNLAVSYAQQNYPSGEPITVSACIKNEPAAAGGKTDVLNAIVVDVHRTVQPGLRAAVAGGPIDVPAEAEAVVTTVQPQCNVWPFVMMSPPKVGSDPPIPQVFDTIGTDVTLDYSTAQVPGNYGLLQVLDKKHGGNTVDAAIANGGFCPGNVDSLNLDQGQKTGPVKSGWDELIAALDPKPWPTTAQWPDPYWSGSPSIPDNVFWNTSSLGLTPNPDPWGLGSIPSNPNGPCTGAPVWPWDATQFDNYSAQYAVDVGSCPRIGFIPIIDQWPPNGNKDPVTPYDWGAFYIISVTDGGKTVTGSFLQKVTVVGGSPTWKDPRTSALLGYFLWK